MLAAHRTARDDALQLGVHHHVRELKPDATTLARARARPPPIASNCAVSQGAFEHTPAAGECRPIELVIAVGRCVELVHARRRERQEPSQIGRRNEMPGGP